MTDKEKYEIALSLLAECDLNKPFEGDLCKYNGILWVWSQGRWLILEEAMQKVFNVSEL